LLKIDSPKTLAFVIQNSANCAKKLSKMGFKGIQCSNFFNENWENIQRVLFPGYIHTYSATDGPGLPDFSWNNIQKTRKNLPNDPKI
jgi:hypothetical protein